MDVSEHPFVTNWVGFRFPELPPELQRENYALFLVLMVPGRDLNNKVVFSMVVAIYAKVW